MIDDDEQWGNIELPGLSDEKLHSTNWTKVTAAKHATKVRLELQNQDPDVFRERQSATTKNNFKDPNVKLNHLKGIEKKNSDPKHKETMKIARKKEAQSQEGRLRRRKQAIGWLESTEGKEYLSKVLPGLSARRARPLVSIFGVFRSVNILSQYILDNKIFPTYSNKCAVSHKIRNLIKEDPANNFYITLEEYIMLTGREI